MVVLSPTATHDKHMTNYFEILMADMWELSCVVGSCSREATPCATLACRSLFLFYPLTLSTPRPTASLYPSVYVNIDVRTLYIKLPPLPSRTVILCARPLSAVAIHRHASSRYASATHPYGFTPASPSSTMIFLTLTPWLST